MASTLPTHVRNLVRMTTPEERESKRELDRLVERLQLKRWTPEERETYLEGQAEHPMFMDSISSVSEDNTTHAVSAALPRRVGATPTSGRACVTLTFTTLLAVEKKVPDTAAHAVCGCCRVP